MRKLALIVLCLLWLAGCRSNAPTLNLQLPLSSQEKKWFITNLLEPYEAEYGVRVNVFTEAPPDEMDLFTLSTRQLTPRPAQRALPWKELFQQTETAFDSGHLFAPAVEAGGDEYLPLFLNPRMVVFSRAHVLEAFLEWESRRPKIEDALRRFNGKGLPEDYQLEADPAEWDLYDVMVLGLYWGENRVAFEFDNNDFFSNFAELAYSSGSSRDDLLKSKGPAVRNAHYWLKLFGQSAEVGWTKPGEARDRVAQGEAWLGFVNTHQVFSLFQEKTPDSVRSDLDLAPLPRAVSLFLDRQGHPYFQGRSQALLQGCYIGVNPGCTDRERAAHLLQWLLSDGVQQRMAEYLGYLPVKRELQENTLSLFREDWIKDVFTLGLSQLEGETAILPLNPLLETTERETQAALFDQHQAFSRVELDRSVYKVEKAVWEKALATTQSQSRNDQVVRRPLAGRAHLTFRHMDQGEAYSRYLAAAITEFEEAHPGVLVETQEMPMNSDEQLQLYLDSFNQGHDTFDVLAVDVIWIGEFARAGYLAPLAPYLSPQEQSRFLPSLLSACTVDGELSALPWYVDTGLFFYRRDILEEHGLKRPSSYQDLQSHLARLRKAGVSLDGFLFQGKEYEGLVCCFLEYFHGMGERFYSEDYTRVEISRQRLSEILGSFRDLLVQDVAPENVLYYQEEQSRLQFVNGQAVFLRNWPYVWASANAADSPVRGQVGVAPPLSAEGVAPRGVLGGWQLAVNSRSSNKELAARFVEHLTSPKWQKRMCLELGRHPTIDALYSDSDLLDQAPLLEQLHEVVAHAQPRPAVSRYPLFSAGLQRELTALLLGVSSAEEAAHEILVILDAFRAE